MDNLEKLRKEIDKIDQKIIDDIATRTNIIFEIAKYKARNNIVVVDEKREAEVIKKNRALARENNMEEDFIEELYKIIIAYCRNIQKIRK